mmetsp:Transcript_33331/g.83165  ORF Transcript_33331/g.83165 Transcript_33331/m.83165 type:complete len:106 (+) Transcript_33331:270-587(+)
MSTIDVNARTRICVCGGCQHVWCVCGVWTGEFFARGHTTNARTAPLRLTRNAWPRPPVPSVTSRAAAHASPSAVFSFDSGMLGGHDQLHARVAQSVVQHVVVSVV